MAKPKFTQPKQNNDATTEYTRCINCKHHYSNQEHEQKWSCVLKKVNGIFDDGYCDEFMPR